MCFPIGKFKKCRAFNSATQWHSGLFLGFSEIGCGAVEGASGKGARRSPTHHTANGVASIGWKDVKLSAAVLGRCREGLERWLSG